MSHNNLLSISPLILQHKANHLTFCENCQYFPIYNQLQQQIMYQTIYEIKWICSYCKKINKTVTDMHFKYYCFNYFYSYRFNGQSGKRQYKGGMIIDEIYCRKSKLVVYIDISLKMKEGWMWLGEGGKRVNNTSKKQMMLESNLLKTYLQTQAIKMRLQKGRYFSWQKFQKQKMLSKLQYGFWLADKLKNVQKDTTQIVFFSSQSQIVSNKILSYNFFRKLSKYGNNYPNTIASSLFTNYQKLIQNPSSIIIIASSPLKQISQQCIKLSNKLKCLIINLQQMYDPISLHPTSTAKFHQNKLQHNISQLLRSSQHFQSEKRRSCSQNTNLHEYTSYSQTHSQPNHQHNSAFSQFINFSNTKQQKLLIFDSRLLNINSLTQAKQIITYLLQQQQQQISIFMLNKPKNTSKSSHHFLHEIPQKNSWQKIIDRQQCRNFIIQKSTKQNNKLKYQIYKNQKQIKINDILTQYYNLLSKPTSINQQQLQLFLQNTVNTICKDSQIKIILRFSTKYQIKQIINNINNNIQLSQLINQNVYRYTILWYKSKININIHNYQQNIFKYIMGASRQLYIMNLNDDQYISDKYDDVQDMYGRINQKEKDDKVSYINYGWRWGYLQEEDYQQYL